MVEHSTENAGVAGSIPALGARVARNGTSGSSSAVEHFLAKEEVAGSNPVSRPTQRRRLEPSMSGCGAVGSARRSGRRGRWFKSSHPDHPPPPPGEAHPHPRAAAFRSPPPFPLSTSFPLPHHSRTQCPSFPPTPTSFPRRRESRGLRPYRPPTPTAYARAVVTTTRSSAPVVGAAAVPHPTDPDRSSASIALV